MKNIKLFGLGAVLISSMSFSVNPDETQNVNQPEEETMHQDTDRDEIELTSTDLSGVIFDNISLSDDFPDASSNDSEIMDKAEKIDTAVSLISTIVSFYLAYQVTHR